jgi:tRNA(Ile)-lysidine synthase TilS/MesJ
MKICTKCILPETFPGIKFDENGVCGHCRDFQGIDALNEQKKEYEQKFLDIVEHARARGSYDCMIAYSGGKDSTYTLKVLKERYDLRILAFTIDNGFISDRAFKNMCSVCENLGVDHLVFRPRFDLMKNIFLKASEHDIYSKKTLERASTICTSCIGIVKFVTLKTALEKNIPLIAYGWSPGQAPVNSSVMKVNPQLIRATQSVTQGPLSKLVGSGVDAYFLTEEHFAMAERFPHNVHPLAFLDYNEEMIKEQIRQIGWEEPVDTDSNSTNCLLNAYANDIHIKRFGFHPYVWEIANMVRTGVMDREEGYDKIYGEQPGGLLDEAHRRLGIKG